MRKRRHVGLWCKRALRSFGVYSLRPILNMVVAQTDRSVEIQSTTCMMQVRSGTKERRWLRHERTKNSSCLVVLASQNHSPRFLQVENEGT